MEIIEAVNLVAYLLIGFVTYKIVMIQLDINASKRALKDLESKVDDHDHNNVIFGGKDIGK
jgi:Zn-dependent membrane protease YugP